MLHDYLIRSNNRSVKMGKTKLEKGLCTFGLTYANLRNYSEWLSINPEVQSSDEQQKGLKT